MNSPYGGVPPPLESHARSSIPNLNHTDPAQGQQEQQYQGHADQYSQRPYAPLPQQAQSHNQAYGNPYRTMIPPVSLPSISAEQPRAVGETLPLPPMAQEKHQAMLSEPLPKSRIYEGRKYELEVVQQPKRARMCGFGDKDRRPITPPPCVRLIITDPETGKEIDTNDIEHGMFVLNVDLWSMDGTTEVNLVRHSATSPQISNTMSASFAHIGMGTAAPTYASSPSQVTAQLQGRSQHHPYSNGANGYKSFAYPNQPDTYGLQRGAAGYGEPQYQQAFPPAPHRTPSYPPPNGYPAPPGQNYGYAGTQQVEHRGSVDYSMGNPAMPLNAGPYPGYAPGYGHRITAPGSTHSSQPTGMFTRNLIGSLAASAFRLADIADHIGIWFILQDLSVRTEGHFRLRFSFVNVGASAQSSQNGGNRHSGSVTHGHAPVLAACFSESFRVYSAKRFPGVVESTNLSKCFATQGIKIPIRKDGPKGKDKEGNDSD